MDLIGCKRYEPRFLRRFFMDHSLEKAKPYYEQIYQTIKQLIFQGMYKPGERIYEAKLAKEFNVSRSPVREAVRAIEKEGLLVLNERQQLVVYKPSLADVKDIYLCRGGLESLSVKLLTEMGNPDALKALEEVLEQTKNVLLKPEPSKDEIVTCNTQFHDMILNFSDNKRLQKMLSDLRSLTYFYRILNVESAERRKTIYEEHDAIFQAMKQGDSSLAGERMYRHMEHDLDHLIMLLKKEGLE